VALKRDKKGAKRETAFDVHARAAAHPQSPRPAAPGLQKKWVMKGRKMTASEKGGREKMKSVGLFWGRPLKRRKNADRRLKRSPRKGATHPKKITARSPGSAVPPISPRVGRNASTSELRLRKSRSENPPKRPATERESLSGKEESLPSRKPEGSKKDFTQQIWGGGPCPFVAQCSGTLKKKKRGGKLPGEKKNKGEKTQDEFFSERGYTADSGEIVKTARISGGKKKTKRKEKSFPSAGDGRIILEGKGGSKVQKTLDRRKEISKRQRRKGRGDIDPRTKHLAAR